MTKVIIIGLNSFSNRGVEALGVSIIEQILANWPDADITLLCKDVEYNKQKLKGYNVSCRSDAYREVVAKACYVLGCLFTPIPDILSKTFKEVRSLVKSADLIISTGGDNFGKDYGPFHNHLTPFMEAQKNGQTTVFLGQSIGPFKTVWSKKLFQRVARQSILLTCRESLSYEFCKTKLKLPSEKIKMVGDVAFLMQPTKSDKAESILAQEGIVNGHPRIVFSISGGISKFSNVNRRAHLEKWAQIINYFYENVGSRVIILPHVWKDDKTIQNNDMVIGQEILKIVTKQKAILLKQNLSAKDYKGIMGVSDFIVAERMHASIAGLSQCIPTISISYSIKADGIIGDLFDDFEKDRRPVISIQDLIEDDNVAHKMLYFYNNKESIKIALEKSIPAMKKKAKKNFELLAPYFQ